jgi:imidazolonepropionase-like amidohydrolase
MRRFLLCTVTIPILAGLPGPAAQTGQTVAFTNVSVLPMDSNRVLQNQTVIVTNGRIAALGPAGSAKVPAGATQVEGRGKFLMPGLAEMHGHVPPPTAPKELTENVLFLYAASGVTTVRGMQGAPGQLELRERAKSGELIAPTLYLAGPPFSGNAVKTPEDASARVRQQKSEGWDLLKVLTGLSIESYDAMARTAKEAGIPFAGHVPAAVGIVHALDMGQQTIDHIDGYAEHLDGETKPVAAAAVQDLVARTKKAGAWIVPTLVVWETLRGPVTLESRTGLAELKYLPRDQVTQWTGALQKRLTNPQFNSAQAKLYIDNRMQLLRALHAGGVGILLGSDAPQQFNVPGFSIHREMKRMADAGMSQYEILKSGTANVGQYFKAQDDFGTIAVGKRADLILVDGNPLQDLANAERRSGVMIRGRWIPEADIQWRLRQIAAAYEKGTQ